MDFIFFPPLTHYLVHILCIYCLILTTISVLIPFRYLARSIFLMTHKNIGSVWCPCDNLLQLFSSYLFFFLPRIFFLYIGKITPTVNNSSRQGHFIRLISRVWICLCFMVDQNFSVCTHPFFPSALLQMVLLQLLWTMAGSILCSLKGENHRTIREFRWAGTSRGL